MTKDEILSSLVEGIAQILDVEPSAVNRRERFSQYGLDSLGTTRIIATLSKSLGRSLSPTLAWEYPSAEALATFLAEPGAHDSPAIPAALKHESIRLDEPIAIVGMACRFPGGANDPHLFWRRLCEGFDAITEVPASRWSVDTDVPPSRRPYLRRGGFLQDVEGFDPLHFHVSPREAEQMDPQQRLMLELTWEAIEDAAIAPDTLHGSATGVFTGVVFGDYDVIQDVTGAHQANQYTTTGSVQSVIANRISYAFGLSGPSCVVNAACASSLLAVHLACQSLRNRECTVALAGGVQLNIAMSTSLGVSEFGALSPDGVCRTFDADANGYVRGEGAGVVVLRTLSDARRRGERIYAIIRGSSTNNNGTGNGLTAPNPEAQRAVIVDALARAHVEPASVQYVELHGTATILGDPIEASALGTAYTRHRSTGPKLLVGSVKTNIGHLEAGAGIAGLMKTALALYHQRVPPSLHFKRGNPYIDFESLKIEVVTSVRSWPDTRDGICRAGVSSFGFGGTNVHAILESWAGPSVHMLPLAAESPERLEELVSRMRDWLVNAPQSVSAAEICSSAGHWLTSGPRRIAVFGTSRDSLAQALEDASSHRALGERATSLSKKPVFVFSGLGSQWAGMSRRVWDTNSVFVAALRQCDACFEPIAGWSIIRTLFDDDAADLVDGMDRLDIIVPVLVATQIAMARLWMSLGIEPGALIGHSVGEIAAAHLAGVLDLQEAMLIAHHTALAYRTSFESGTGMLAFLGCPANEIQNLRKAENRDDVVAGQNDPLSCIVSGVAADIRELVQQCTQRGIFARILGNVYAHCSAVRAFTTNLPQALETHISSRKPRVPLMSTVTGTWISHFDDNVAHWLANIEQPVRFRAGIESLWHEGFDCFVEMSPHAILTRSITTTINAMGGEPIVMASDLRGEAEQAPLLKAVGRMFEVGATVNWSVFMPADASNPALPSDVCFDRKNAPQHPLPQLLVLSARTESALNDYARKLGDHLQGYPDLDLPDVAYGLSMTRSTMDHRIAIVASSRENALEGLAVAAQGQTSATVVRGMAGKHSSNVVFVFPGQGSQWAGMGRQLYREELVFRDVMAACDEAIRREAGFSVLEELDKPNETSRLGETIVAQPALFAIEVALAKLFQSRGIVPSMVVGHSVGEIAAAHIAGMIDLGQSARLVSLRARIMQKATGRGKMVSVALTEAEAKEAITGFEARVGVAAVNDPNSVVLSGEIDAIDKLVEQFSARGLIVRPLRVDYAFHSPQMEPLSAEFLAALGSFESVPATIPMISTVTGKPISGRLNGAYWAQNIRQTVQFAQAVKSAVGDGHTIFVELGPHPVLAASIQQALSEQLVNAEIVPTLRREKDERQHVLAALGTLYTHGCSVDWRELFPNGARVVHLPTYPWQRERYWIEMTNAVPRVPRTAAGQTNRSAIHPLLGLPFSPSTHPDTRYWQQTLSAMSFSWLREHRVNNEVVFPGAGYVELALEAAVEIFGATRVLVENVVFENLLVLGNQAAPDVQVVASRVGERLSFHVASRHDAASQWVKHARGFIRAADQATPPVVESPNELKRRMADTLDATTFYHRIRERSLDYGPSFRGIVEIHSSAADVLVEIRLPDHVEDDDFVLHPALLDACFQASIVHQVFSSNTDGYVPVGLSRLRMHGRPGRTCWVLATKTSDTSSGSHSFSCDLRILDARGTVVVEIDALELQCIDRSTNMPNDGLANCVHEVVWRPAENLPLPNLSSRGTWLVYADRGDMATAFKAQLLSHGQRCMQILPGLAYKHIAAEVVQIDARTPEDYQRALSEFFGDDGHCAGVIHFAGLDVTANPQTTAASLSADLEHATITAMFLAQSIVRHGFRDAPRLFFVTRGAQSVHANDPVAVAQAPILGLGKTVVMEHPELACTRIDLSSTPDSREAELLAYECSTKTREDQIAFRQDRRYVARLVRGDWTRNRNPDAEPAQGRPYQLQIRKPGILEHLGLYQVRMPEPGPGEILIRVEAAGLNFRDVLMAMNLLPDDDGMANSLGPRLGGECAGTVVAVGGDHGGDGRDVMPQFVLGQSVIAVTERAFGSFVIARRVLCTVKPENLTWEQAASLPLVFMTAYYALEHVARLRKGERVLIHAGTGGVGLAAIQWAKHVGAEIFATAGSDEKREYLRDIGVPHVLNSRTLEFVDEIKRITQGKGVDVVLNSLAGEFIPASLSVLGDWGRFVEIGKRDYYEDKPLPTRHFLHNLSFSLFDLWALIVQYSERAGALLAEISSMFAAGLLKPLPTRNFPISQAAEAFQYMAQAKHIGKISLVMHDNEARIFAGDEIQALRVRQDRTYLITGGLGGLGLSLAQWFVAQGARNLVLVGRNAAGESALKAIQRMEEAGACVQVMPGDVSRESDVKRLLMFIRETMPPLAGIVHAAAVLKDRTLLEQSKQTFDDVFGPKALGAWNLHEHSKSEQLDFFIMYSSVASLLGSPGQANYCASNAFLDALARERVRCGLPAMSIQWGGFRDVGLAAENDLRAGRLSSRGLEAFAPADGLEAMRRLFLAPRPEIGIVRFDLRQWLEFYPHVAGSPFFVEMPKQDLVRDKNERQAMPMLVQLRAALPKDRGALLEGHVTALLGAVLRLDPKRIDRMAPMQNLGMDSLMSLELRRRLEAAFGVKLAATVSFTYSTPLALTEHLQKLLFATDAPNVVPDSKDEKVVETSEISRDDIQQEANQLSGESLLDALARELLDD